MSPYAAEFLGTLILVLLGDSVVAGVLLKGTKSENAGWLVVVLAWGLAVTTAVYAVGNISGAHINPAVTLGLAYVGAFPWSQVGGYFLAQLGGAFVGAILVWIQYYPHWSKTEDASAKLAVFCTSPAIRSTFANCVSEIIATAVLVFGILALGANDFANGLKPLVVGLLIITIGLCLGGTTGFAINPARDLGPRIAHFLLPIPGKRDSDWSYAWIPVVAPLIGSLVGAFFYQAMFGQ
jgi:glycerol uptake facilitator protein